MQANGERKLLPKMDGEIPFLWHKEIGKSYTFFFALSPEKYKVSLSNESKIEGDFSHSYFMRKSKKSSFLRNADR